MHEDKREILETGHVVVWRNGTYGVVMRNYLGDEDMILDSSDRSFIPIGDYDCGLRNARGSDIWDIMKVIAPVEFAFNPWEYDSSKFGSWKADVVWSRDDEPRKMTMQEVCNALGHSVEIIPG